MLDEKLLIELQEYVERHSSRFNFALCESPIIIERDVFENIQHNELEDFIKNTRKPTFRFNPASLESYSLILA